MGTEEPRDQSSRVSEFRGPLRSSPSPTNTKGPQPLGAKGLENPGTLALLSPKVPRTTELWGLGARRRTVISDSLRWTVISDSLRSAADSLRSAAAIPVGAMPCRRPPRHRRDLHNFRQSAIGGLPLRTKGFSSQRADTGVCPYGELRPQSQTVCDRPRSTDRPVCDRPRVSGVPWSRRGDALSSPSPAPTGDAPLNPEGRHRGLPLQETRPQSQKVFNR